jgi:hypothetical protein
MPERGEPQRRNEMIDPLADLPSRVPMEIAVENIGVFFAQVGVENLAGTEDDDDGATIVF